MTDDERNPKPKGRRLSRHAGSQLVIGHWSLVIGHWSLVIGHSPVVIRHWSFVNATMLLLAASGGWAANAPQPGRFLLIFETSPTLKKNLPAVRQSLGRLFADNLQNEIQDSDDLAVWTVDQSLHTGTFPLASWSPEDAETYSERLNDFLGQQKFTRHASLTNVQPLLNRVIKNSERLTVLIFCDSQSRLLGTPYDSGVNEIITNAAARAKGVPLPFILVLRANHGEYLGCSVNRSGTLNFPKFPPPPPPPAVKPAVVPTPPPVARPLAIPAPSLVIVGTNAGTNLSSVTASAAAPTPPPMPPPMTNPPAMNAAPTIAAVPVTSAPPPEVAAAPPANPVPTPPAPAMPLPTPAQTLQKTSPPAPVAAVAPPAAVIPASPPAVSPAVPRSNWAGAAPENQPAGAGYLRPLAIGGGAVAVAAALTIWLVARARRPRSSLITSSMQNDLRGPPRK